VVAVIRSHGGQSMAGKEPMATAEPTMVEESSKVGLASLACDHDVSISLVHLIVLAACAFQLGKVIWCCYI